MSNMDCAQNLGESQSSFRESEGLHLVESGLLVFWYLISSSERLGILAQSRSSCGLAVGQKGSQRASLVECGCRVLLHHCALFRRISCLYCRCRKIIF